MNFSVYLKQGLAKKISQRAKDLHRSWNSIVTEALEEWLNRHTLSNWPDHFFDFASIEDVPDFKDMRQDLRNEISEDPLK